jgi:hypothetical protein
MSNFHLFLPATGNHKAPSNLIVTLFRWRILVTIKKGKWWRGDIVGLARYVVSATACQRSTCSYSFMYTAVTLKSRLSQWSPLEAAEKPSEVPSNNDILSTWPASCITRVNHWNRARKVLDKIKLSRHLVFF